MTAAVLLACGLLEARFAGGGTDWLLLEARSGETVCARWPDAGRPAAPGSLVKPFTALAYAAAHEYIYPELVCRGCWLPQGHGRVGIVEAIAQSCNTYFEALARETPLDEVAACARRFGLEPPRAGGPAVLSGREGLWRVTPAALARAYCELAHRSQEPGAGPVLEGMARSARSGTGKQIGAPVLVKTGTAPCRHRKRAPGDGLAVAMWPPERPEFVLLVAVHGVPGARAAEVAGSMLRLIREGR